MKTIEARPGLRSRIEKSVELLRKSERLALRYDPDDGFFLAFSGGKDSQVLYHVAQIAGVKFKAHFSPTTVDPPQVIRFIREHYPDCVFEKVEKSIYQVAKEKRMPPTMRVRWCCEVFKEHAGAGRVTLTGVRRTESVRRSKRNFVEVSGHKYSGDIETFFEWQADQVKKKTKNLNQDQFSRDGESEVRCISGKDSIIINPIIEWTDRDVWDFLNNVVKVPHCELYDAPYRSHRIGCILCPMSNKHSKLRDIELYPHVREKWLDVFDHYLRVMGGVVAIYPRIKTRKQQETENPDWENPG